MNDPNTANDVVVRIGSVLVELLSSRLPGPRATIDDRIVVRASETTHDDYVELVIEPIRRYARTEPNVLSTLVRTLVDASRRVAENGGDVSPLTDELTRIRADLYLLETDEDRLMVLRALDRERLG